MVENTQQCSLKYILSHAVNLVQYSEETFIIQKENKQKKKKPVRMKAVHHWVARHKETVFKIKVSQSNSISRIGDTRFHILHRYDVAF